MCANSARGRGIYNTQTVKGFLASHTREVDVIAHLVSFRSAVVGGSRGPTVIVVDVK